MLIFMGHQPLELLYIVLNQNQHQHQPSLHQISKLLTINSGPIQVCNSRLANCNITKITNFSNGMVINNRATTAQRVATLIIIINRS